MSSVDLSAFVAVQDDLAGLVQDYEVVTIAIANLSDHNPDIVAASMDRLNARLEAAIAKVEAECAAIRRASSAKGPARGPAKHTQHLNDALSRLAVMETLISKLDIDDTTVRDGLVIACGDVVEDISTARNAVTNEGEAAE